MTAGLRHLDKLLERLGIANALEGVVRAAAGKCVYARDSILV